MNGICLIWSRGRLISPSLPVGDDGYLNRSSQKRPTGRKLGGNRSVRRSGTTSRGTVILVFCLRMGRFSLTLVFTIIVGMKSRKNSRQCSRHLLVPVLNMLADQSSSWLIRTSFPKSTILPYYSLCKMSKHGNTSPLKFFFKYLDLFKTVLFSFFFALFKSKVAV